MVNMLVATIALKNRTRLVYFSYSSYSPPLPPHSYQELSKQITSEALVPSFSWKSLAFSYEIYESASAIMYAMFQVLSRWTFIEETRIRSRNNPCEFCGGSCGTGSSCWPSDLILPCLCHSTKGAYQSPSSCCSLSEGQQSEVWETSGKATLSQQWGTLEGKVLFFF
jgi:hypothetical protein